MGRPAKKNVSTTSSVVKNQNPNIKKKVTIDESYKDLNLTELRKLYAQVALGKKRLEEGAYCHKCGKFMPKSSFYLDNRNASGCLNTCKSCIFTIATNYDKRTKVTNETEDSIKKALKLCNRPFIRAVYDASYNAINNEASSKQRKYIFTQYITLISSLTQYSSLSWDDSDVNIIDDEKETGIKIKKANKRMREFWGEAFSDADLIYLDKEYVDWTTRNEVNTKPMEEIIKRLCFKQLEIYKATISGASTKDLDKTFQELLDSANLKPKQLNNDVLASDRTFGQLIDLWETEKPIPEPEDEFKDVDKIGKYISVFFLGHLAKMIGIENRYSKMYDDEMAKYTVTNPEYEEDTELLFEAMFGREKEE